MRQEDLELMKKTVELFESAERNFSTSLQQMSKDMAKTMTDDDSYNGPAATASAERS